MPVCARVELDFVPGFVNPAPNFKGQLWGGLALAVLLPTPRTGSLEMGARAEMTFQIAHEVTSRRGKRVVHWGDGGGGRNRSAPMGTRKAVTCSGWDRAGLILTVKPFRERSA